MQIDFIIGKLQLLFKTIEHNYMMLRDAVKMFFLFLKVESPTQTIKIEQSQSDRSKKPFHPVR